MDALAGRQASAASYTVSNLEDFISYDVSLYEELVGYSLNDDGNIAGTYHPIYPPGYKNVATYWDAGGAHEIATPSFAVASAINDLNTIAGATDLPDGSRRARPFQTVFPQEKITL